MSGTSITSDVDFEAYGKQQGYLRVPHSVHRSAYRWIPMPITVLRQKAGWAITRGIAFGPQGAGFGQLSIAFPRSRLSSALDQLVSAVSEQS